MCLAGYGYCYFLANIIELSHDSRKRTTGFDAHFSGTLLTGWLVAEDTLVAFDRGRLCDRHLVVAKIRITCAFGTEKRRAAVFRIASSRSARTERT